jgi:sortase A
MKGKKKTDIILIIIFLVGLSVLLYPTISNYYNSFHESKVIAAYETNLSKMTETDYSGALQKASDYNSTLSAGTQSFESGEPVDSTYSSLLNLSDDGMMGYITISKLDVELPIYHGTSDSVLAVGAGHLEGSSLPVGGIGTHSVIMGHRGLPSAKLFTDLDQMEIGDTFTITVMNQTLTYQVDNIAIVDPDELDLLKIDPDKDYCTLVTCTPYGINTQRLLVRGVRTENVSVLPRITADAVKVDPLISAMFTAVPILAVLAVIMIVHGFRHHRKGARHADEN